ncbi:MAG: aspartate aminotransferase family protein [Marinilabiliales bacterium]|nr:MAG: aspartate aminotransferase family protein [Marinilabiliales bacterium]
MSVYDKAIDWLEEYFRELEKYPVKSLSKPGDIYNQIPPLPPESGENYDAIFQDVNKKIIPGITHWQHPMFMAYFPANSSEPSLMAEMITAGMGAQCMKWETSPAAAELEERMMQWLRQMIGLPEVFEGVIQDSASSATLCSILTAREKFSNYNINKYGYSGMPKYRVYCSDQAHSSIERAVRIAGIGSANLVKVAVNDDFSMNTSSLEEQIQKDLKEGLMPLCVVSALGTTSTTAVDDINRIGDLCEKYRVWHHVDAAYSGSALILPEYKNLIHGVEKADSFVFNPHKWLFTNFDCSAYFVKDKHALINTFSLIPEYLNTGDQDVVNDYSNWGVPLGRRFRALKLWFVIRHFGVEGLKNKLKAHIEFAHNLKHEIQEHKDFEILAPALFNVICFRYLPAGVDTNEEINRINKLLLEKINQSGKLFLSHTVLNGKYTIRIVTGQTNLTREHVDQAWRIILREAEELTSRV